MGCLSNLNLYLSSAVLWINCPCYRCSPSSRRTFWRPAARARSSSKPYATKSNCSKQKFILWGKNVFFVCAIYRRKLKLWNIWDWSVIGRKSSLINRSEGWLKIGFKIMPNLWYDNWYFTHLLHCILYGQDDCQFYTVGYYVVSQIRYYFQCGRNTFKIRIHIFPENRIRIFIFEMVGSAALYKQTTYQTGVIIKNFFSTFPTNKSCGFLIFNKE